MGASAGVAHGRWSETGGGLMKLLLTHGYFLAEDPKEQAIMKPYPPLGILYLSAHLRAKSFEVEIYDSTFGSRQELFAIIEHGPPAVIGIYANLMTRGNAIEIAQQAKAVGWRVIFGGPEPANYAGEYLAYGDVVVCGEGEAALEQLLASNLDAAAWGSIAGLAFRAADGQVVRTGPARLVRDLDAQPWPDRTHIDIPAYLKTWRAHHGLGSISVITARGCPYRCNWCSHSVYGITHRRRSPASVADEVEWLLDRYHPDMLWMADDVFTIHPGWIHSYAAELKKRSIRLPFECITRADRIDASIAATLAEMGCMRVWIGSESGSQQILDAMQRGVTVDQVRRAVELCRQNRIQTGMFFMWGYEGEELSDIEATAEHVKQCRPDVFYTTISYPIKGTPYFEKVKARLVHLAPWNQTSDREIRIGGRHSRRYYRYADDLLRSQTAEQAMAAREGLHASASEVEA
jgi:anaerobic magnesium-protoporphyrin IX monomethyl ester cyclase